MLALCCVVTCPVLLFVCFRSGIVSNSDPKGFAKLVKHLCTDYSPVEPVKAPQLPVRTFIEHDMPHMMM